ncbi:MAG: hypothetical protein WCS27_07480 [Victivallaceae bacterium]
MKIICGISVFILCCSLLYSSDKKQIGILDNSLTAKQWHKELKDMTDLNVLMLNERQLGLFGTQFKVLEKGISRDSYLLPKHPEENIDILLLPNTHIYGFSAAIEKFAENGGKIIATQGAGYINGKYSLLNTLRAGRRNITIPLLYWHYLDHDLNEYRKLAKWCAQKGADGLAMYSYIWTLAPGSRNKFLSCGLGKRKFPIYSKMADTTQTTTECFKKFADWKSKKKPGLLGEFDTPKVLFCKGWLLNGIYKSSPDEIVKYAKKIGANTINFDFHLNPVYPQATYDYLSGLEKLCKENNIRFWVDVFITGKGFPVKESHCQTTERGIKNKGMGVICPLGGREVVLEINKAIEHLLKKYPHISVLLLDEPWLSSMNKKSWCCFCPACKREFKKRYGRELTPDEIESPDFMEFREKIQADYFALISKAVNHANPRVKLGIWTCPGYELCGINPRLAASAGVTVWGWEYSRALREYEKTVYSVEGNDQYYLAMPEINGFRQQFFRFNKLSAESEHPLLHGVNLSKFRGKGNIIDAFNGARIIAWMTNGINTYPAIVLSHNGHCIYFSFDPLSQGAEGRRLLKNAIKILKNN